MRVDVYLTFNGNCEEAFTHYKEVFGGDFGCKMTWADNPHKNEGKAPLDEEKAKEIMHMSLCLTEHFTLMGCDQPPETSDCGGPEGFVRGNNVQINLEPNSREHADELIKKLSSKGGAIAMPMSDTFWGAHFGMCKDPYGITWMLNYSTGGPDCDEKKEEEEAE